MCVTVMLCFSMICILFCFVFFFKQKTAYEMRISDWSSDVCSSDLARRICQPDHRMLRADIFAVHRHADHASDGCGVDDRSLRAALDQIGRASCRERVCQYV